MYIIVTFHFGYEICGQKEDQNQDLSVCINFFFEDNNEAHFLHN